jgi:hypothetical protein
MHVRLMAVVIAVGCLLPRVEAKATVTDYCEAFARDVADQLEQQGPRWDRRFNNAQQDCNQRFGLKTKIITEPEPKLKPRIPKKPKPKPETVEVETPQVSAKSASKPDLVEGSAAWLAYCKKKYVSFNPAKGTYIGKSGTERKCLVTAD